MTPGRYGGNIGKPTGPPSPWAPPALPRLRQLQNPKPCPGCGNHFIHQTTCSNYKPGSNNIFKWPADSADN